MKSKYESSPGEVERMNTSELRENFLVEGVFINDTILMNYTHYDRMILGGAHPVYKSLELSSYPELKSEYFLERRELGIINVGGAGIVSADNQKYNLDKLGCLYLGKGTRDIIFDSVDSAHPARFFLLSAPAHATFPNRFFTKEEALPVNLGAETTANVRTIYKYIHQDGIMSCQLVMGLTVLSEGNVWNTMPPHTHDRRSEIYFYFDIRDDHGVMHFMGRPEETRHIWVQNYQAIISPPWSIHAGAGSASYAFIWGMAGENKDFTDMDHVLLNDIR